MPIDACGEYEWDECANCSGTGDDDSPWDGRCVYCNGRGEIKRYFDDEEDE